MAAEASDNAASRMEEMAKYTLDKFDYLIEQANKTEITVEELIKIRIDLYKKQLAIKGAKEKLRLDPKQIAKEQIYILYWVRWENKPDLYLSKAEFSRDMIEKFPVLTSTRTIEVWCREWEKNTHPASSMSIELA